LGMKAGNGKSTLGVGRGQLAVSGAKARLDGRMGVRAKTRLVQSSGKWNTSRSCGLRGKRAVVVGGGG
jgi:hypothetical protein